MAVFVELTTDAFEDVFRQKAKGMQGGDSSGRTSRAGASTVRRPFRGIEIKEDTYAVLKVIRADGQEIPLFDSSRVAGQSTLGYANFLLQSVAEAREEKAQIVQTFGDNYVFFFGEDPRFLDCQATLLNTHDFNWRAEWWENYDTFLRGSKLAEMGARLYMFYDDVIIEGYLMNCRATEQSMSPYTVQVQFRLFVTNYQNISFVGDPNFPIRSSVVLPDNIELTKGNAGSKLTNYYRGEALDAINATSTDTEFQQAAASGATGGGANPLASGSRISRIIQRAPASFAVSQNFWDFLFSTANFDEVKDLRNLIVRQGAPIRGLIAENLDEFTGPGTGTTDYGYHEGEEIIPTTYKGIIRDQFEADDLFQEAIRFLSCFGANIDDPGLLNSLGLGPNFSSGGASYTPSGKKQNNPSPLASLNALLGDNGAKDPTENIYGKPDLGVIFGSKKPKYTEGAGDPLYGYPSDFANGKPGFGQAGFGDLGGSGFGSALGESGDPGFKNPDKFTFAGVADNRGAFDRFTQPKQDNTALTVSIGAGASVGTGGASAGAGISVGGKPSSFAVVSVAGTLDSEGLARQRAAAIAELQAQQKFGFANPNPFGVNCPSPSDGGLSFSIP